MSIITIDSTDFVEAPEGSKSLLFDDEKQQANFELGVSMAIHAWDALETAVVNGWGGPQSQEKRDWISSIVIDLFQERVVDIQLIEDTILNAMLDEFDVSVEDDSSLPIADQVIRFYRQVSEKDYIQIHQVYNNWKEKQQKRAQSSQQHQHVHLHEDPQNPDASDESDEEDEDVPRLQGQPIQEDVDMLESEPSGPIIDDDGFELVQKKGRRRN